VGTELWTYMQVLKMEARIRNLYKEGSPSLCVGSHALYPCLQIMGQSMFYLVV
jgi:hypothetical protein